MDGSARGVVVDSSFILSFLFPDEQDPVVGGVLSKFREGSVGLYSSFLLPFEVTNALNLAVTRKRIDEDTVNTLLEKFLNLDIVYLDLDFLETAKIARKYKLTAYDAAYLALSEKENLPLRSLDSHLKPFCPGFSL